MVLDYEEIAAAVQPLVDELDHRNLNERFGGIQTTAEELARWFWSQLHSKLPLSMIDIHETASTRVRFVGHANGRSDERRPTLVETRE
jgi:6-pyruvoyltetrahydropterin/6-carboxytetrahydropterin synthase